MTKIIAVLLVLAFPLTAFAGHGAIAYSPSTHRVGYSYGYDSNHGAKWGAISACGVGDCTWKVVEHDEYGVLATGTGGPTVAWNPDFACAERDALAACNDRGTNCTVRAWVFS